MEAEVHYKAEGALYEAEYTLRWLKQKIEMEKKEKEEKEAQRFEDVNDDEDDEGVPYEDDVFDEDEPPMLEEI